MRVNRYLEKARSSIVHTFMHEAYDSDLEALRADAKCRNGFRFEDERMIIFGHTCVNERREAQLLAIRTEESIIARKTELRDEKVASRNGCSLPGDERRTRSRYHE